MVYPVVVQRDGASLAMRGLRHFLCLPSFVHHPFIATPHPLLPPPPSLAQPANRAVEPVAANSCSQYVIAQHRAGGGAVGRVLHRRHQISRPALQLRHGAASLPPSSPPAPAAGPATRLVPPSTHTRASSSLLYSWTCCWCPMPSQAQLLGPPVVPSVSFHVRCLQQLLVATPSARAPPRA